MGMIGLGPGLSCWTGASTAAPFTPPDSSNLVLWLDASAITGLSNNDPVAQWNDLSGLGNHVTQGTGSAQPTYKTNIQNSLPSVYFDGGDYLLKNSIASYFTGDDKPMTMIVAQQITVGKRVYSGFGNAASNAKLFLVDTADTAIDAQLFRMDDAAVSKSPKVTCLDTDPYIREDVFNGQTVDLYHNGTKKMDAVDLNVGTVTLDTFAIGAWIYTVVHPVKFTGYKHEILLYKSALSEANLTYIRSYLASKWSITVA